MSKRKKLLEDFDPNKSDSADGDYGEPSPPSKRARSVKKPAKKAASKQKRKTTRRDKGYTDDDDDIVDDEEEDLEEESFGDESAGEPEPVVTTRSGRPARNVAQKQIKYDEDSDVELEAIEELQPVASTRRPNQKDSGEAEAEGSEARPSLIVKIRPPPEGFDYLKNAPSKANPKQQGANIRARSRANQTPAPLTRRNTRTTSTEPFKEVEIQNSGRNEVAVAVGSQGNPAHRPTQGRKGPMDRPSIIMEESQDTSKPSFELGESPGADDLERAVAATIRQEEEDEHRAASAHSQVPAIAESFQNHTDDESHNSDESDESDELPFVQGRNKARPSIEVSKTAQPPKGSAKRKRESSDYNDDEGNQDERSESEESSPRSKSRKLNRSTTTGESGAAKQGKRLVRGKGQSFARQPSSDELEAAAELDELVINRPRARKAQNGRQDDITFDKPQLRERKGPSPRYTLAWPPEVLREMERMERMERGEAPADKQRPAAWHSAFSTQGPFGGSAGRPLGVGDTGDVDSDSSDDEMSTLAPGGVIAGVGQVPHAPHAQKLKGKTTVAEVDPLTVDPDTNFDKVGGLGDKIFQLKEMVTLPLLYPELFERFKTTPPRGVLFHGPPGTGKTLMARALSNEARSGGKKITFFMRKGGDLMNKYVGEAERQLGQLFDEAKKSQPSIIFFDEIDGVAPARSGGEGQNNHASIVATLLALMDGMDGRGQVIVIGATNRPDAVDSALRRPGRFDKEFFFPLPDTNARRDIIDILTKGWEPPVLPRDKDWLAQVTKGYGGADLKAVCTEATLNAIQGTFPQIYGSNRKLQIDPSEIKVVAKDFMLAVNKTIPSSGRAGASIAAPLTKTVEPLLRSPLSEVRKILDDILPQKNPTNALEEAQYDDREAENGFEREMMMMEFERARVFRPRLLIRGVHGMGQQALGSALLHQLERVHVQFFDLQTLLEDTARSPAAAIIQLFKEVRRHQPGVIYIPNVDTWYQTLDENALKTFTTSLRSLSPNDQILLLGVMEQDREDSVPDKEMIRDLFGFSTKNQYKVPRPDKEARKEYFQQTVSYIKSQPTAFPDQNRKKREFAQLEFAPEEKPRGPTKQDLMKARKMDLYHINQLKLLIQQHIMDPAKKKHTKLFRTPTIPDSAMTYLLDEADPTVLATDVPDQQQEMHRPYEYAKDPKGNTGILEVATNKFFYNICINLIDQRLANGCYARPKDLVEDFKKLTKDATMTGEIDREVKAKELLSNVEVNIMDIEMRFADLIRDCEAAYVRGLQLQVLEMQASKEGMTDIQPNIPEAEQSGDNAEPVGPIIIEQPSAGQKSLPPVTPTRPGGSGLSNGDSTGNDTNSHPRQSNGSAVPSHGADSTQIDLSQDGEEHRDKRARLDDGASSGPNTQGRSQHSAHQAMAAGTQASDYHNSASTTTSGQKTNTQSTGGTAEHRPDYSVPWQSGGSQVADTQEPPHDLSSQATGSQHSQHSQVQNMPPPPTALANILNNNDSADPQLANLAPMFICDQAQLEALHMELTTRTSGLSVEQLEQVNATLMDAIWRARHNWNRNQVLHQAQSAFNDIMADIEEMQRLMAPSQEVEHDE